MAAFIKQVCESNNQYFQTFVPSDSNPNAFYQITVPYPQAPREEWLCTCYDWQHRSHVKGYCKHIARYGPCHWSGESEEQTVWQEKAHICPRCGRHTIEIEYDA